MSAPAVVFDRTFAPTAGPKAGPVVAPPMLNATKHAMMTPPMRNESLTVKSQNVVL